MNEEEKHLDPEQLEMLLEKPTGSDEERGVKLAAARQHLAVCTACQKLVFMYEQTGRDLDELKTDRPQLRTPQCPDEQVIWELAAGILSPEQSEYVLKHVVSCDYCGPAFRQALADSNEDPSESENAILSQLETAKPARQATLAMRLAAQRSLSPAKPSLLWFFARKNRRNETILKVAAIAAVVALAWLGFRAYSHDRPSYANRLLAQSYVMQRTLEMRIPGAEFAPMRVERGAPRSRMDRPAVLLEAEDIIARRLARSPDDPQWLQAKGRADLLDGNYTAAMSSFEKALERIPDVPDLQADLATAYFSRAESEDRASDYAIAVEFFGKALQKEPDNAVVLFNRAIALERMFLYRQALDDWDHYLRVDPAGAWSAEARRHIEQLKLKQRERDNTSLRPLLQPEQVGKQLSFQDGSTVLVGKRIEEYQAAALRGWLTAGFPLPSERPSAPAAVAARDALTRIATIDLVEHQDAWLHDLLLSSSSPQFPLAVAQLRDAVVASQQADYDRALEKAALARRTFAGIGNIAGVARADFERIFALQFSRNASDCVRALGPLLKSLNKSHYPWILSQAEIEEGICENLLGEFGPADTALSAALSHAGIARYSVTAARALTMKALVQWSAGNGDLAWQQLRQGAATCWSFGCPAMTLYSVYANMDNLAEESEQWQLQVAVAAEAVLTIGSDPDLLMRAVEHNRLAKAAALAHATRIAEENFAIAAQLLAKAPQTEVTRHYEAGIDVDLAKLASRQGNVSLAQHYLDQVQPQLPNIADHYILVDYFRTLAGLKLRGGDLNEAESSLKWAVSIAERELKSLSSDRDRTAWMSESGDIYRDWVFLELQRGHPELALRIWESFLAASLRFENKSGAQKTPRTEADVFVLNRNGEGPPQFPPLDELTSASTLHHETLISYAIVSGRVAAWILDDRGLFFFWITENVDELLVTARRFTRACTSPNSSSQSLRNDGRYLYQRLIGPLVQYLDPTRTLLFDGDAVLADIPMQALVDESGNYLGDTHSSSNLPSLRHFLRLRPASVLTRHDPALIVSVSGSGSVVRESVLPLFDSGDEAKSVAQRFFNPNLMQERDARSEAIEREMRRAVVFHYAGHTTTGAFGNGLLLTGVASQKQVPLLDAARIRSLHPAVLQLAVLSACSTESSGRRGLQDTDSLALAFLEAGVPHVVASRWNVDSATTTKLMTSFYDGVLAGKSVSVALRDAAREIRSDPSTAKPYYWAAFSSFGAP